jgi:hypothetical protein
MPAAGALALERGGRRNCSPYCRTDHGCRLQPDADSAAFVDKGALDRNSPDDVLGGQYWRHFMATPTGMFASYAIVGVKRF